jgi:hypothetical protein
MAIRVAATAEQAVGADQGSSTAKLRRAEHNLFTVVYRRAEVYPLVSSDAEERGVCARRGHENDLLSCVFSRGRQPTGSASALTNSVQLSTN